MVYMVVVNGKWIISVEAESALGAEHKILDTLNGIEGAQAFTAEELNTDTFKWFLENGETISYSGLHELSENYTDCCRALADRREGEKAVADEIARLEKQLEELRHDKSEWAKAVQYSKLDVQDAKKALNMTDWDK